MALLVLLTAVLSVAVGMLVGGLSGLCPNSPGQNQVALVGPRAGGKREHQTGSRIPVKVWDD